MNVYTQLTTQVVSELTTGLASLGYAPLSVLQGVWKPQALPEFDKYLVYVAPPLNNVWTERRISTKEVQYVLRADIYLLVKNFSEELSVYGDTAPSLGLFQLISDVKDLLRGTNLNGMLSRTYDETTGDVSLHSAGFDTGPRSWVHRARVPYTAETEPFCFPPS
jgi:hypothetical protein